MFQNGADLRPHIAGQFSKQMFTTRSARTGMYRGLKFWEAAVKEAGSLNQEAVIKALDHAKIAAGPGGPAEMVPDSVMPG